MVTGRRAFVGYTEVSLIGNIMNAEPAALATLQPLTPPSLDRVVRKCLAKHPDGRWDTAHDVADELRWVAQTIEATVATPLPASRWVRRVLPAIGGLLVGTLLGSLVVWRLWPPLAPAVVRSTIELPPGSSLTLNSPTFRFPGRTEFAFSPDGQHLAISASRDGSESGAMLYLRALDAADSQPIAGTEGARQPFFSPDGHWIGFWANGKLRKVPRLGGIPTELFATPSLPKGAFWSEDGTILLGGGGLRRIPADGGTAEVLTALDPKRETDHSLPFLLPDGKTVLFTATPDNFGHRARVEAVAIGGGPRRQLIDDAADARYLRTGHIVFLRRGVLMAARFDPDRLDVGPAVPLVEGVEQALNMGGSSWHSGAGQFSVSASGSLVYGAGGIGHLLENELVWVSRDGGTETLAGFDRTDVANQVRLSPDGRRLAFVQQAGPLWLFDLERGGYTRVTPDGLAAAPRWNPDRQRLGFAWSSAGSLQAWQVSVAGGSDALEPLAAESAWLSSWSPDGRFLALVGDTPETGNDVLIYRAEDQKTLPFLRTRASEAWPEFSPDGRWLAYVSDETGRPEVYLRSFPDPSRKVQVSIQGGRQPSWSPDMRELFFVSLPPMKMMKVGLRFSPDVWVGRSQPLFDFQFLTCSPMRGYDLDRDGQRFLLTRTRRRPAAEITRINLIQNWFVELKAKVPVR